jgi:hypothetical protein
MGVSRFDEWTVRDTRNALQYAGLADGTVMGGSARPGIYEPPYNGAVSNNINPQFANYSMPLAQDGMRARPSVTGVPHLNRMAESVAVSSTAPDGALFASRFEQQLSDEPTPIEDANSERRLRAFQR